jgi:hypothetical protein
VWRRWAAHERPIRPDVVPWSDDRVNKARIQVNKPEAARRQIDTAVRLTFGGEDPIAIHSIAAAARQIVKDICESRGIEGYLRFTDWIVEGHENGFWSAINRAANFLKHADQDADAIHEMSEKETDFVILFASQWYRDLGFTPSLEMRTFVTWMRLCHPNSLTEKELAAMTDAGVDSQHLRSLPRSEQLKVGQSMLAQALAPPGRSTESSLTA